jgi:hypothetical protein
LTTTAGLWLPCFLCIHRAWAVSHSRNRVSFRVRGETLNPRRPSDLDASSLHPSRLGCRTRVIGSHAPFKKTLKHHRPSDLDASSLHPSRLGCRDHSKASLHPDHFAYASALKSPIEMDGLTLCLSHFVPIPSSLVVRFLIYTFVFTIYLTALLISFDKNRQGMQLVTSCHMF